MVLRSTDPKFLAAVERWFKRLGKELHPLHLQNGGPIIAIQVENEYGSFGSDHAYMEAVKDMLVRSGIRRRRSCTRRMAPRKYRMVRCPSCRLSSISAPATQKRASLCCTACVPMDHR